MMYAEEDRIGRWHAPGWIRDLEGFGVDEVKAGMFPVCIINVPSRWAVCWDALTGHCILVQRGDT